MKMFKRLFTRAKPNREVLEPPLLQNILSNLHSVKRQAYLPLVEDGDFDIAGSKFSGIPQTSSKHPWPICPSCNQKMQLFWQQALSGGELNHDYPITTGLLQLFYCVTDEPLCEDELQSYDPFSKAVNIRVVDALGEVKSDEPSTLYPAKSIVGWNVVDDYPGCEELYGLGIELSDEEIDVYAESYPIAGEKIGGWPHWVQGVEYPNCSKCSERMTYLLQIDSERNIPYMFGDVGVGHLSYCPKHPEVMSFHWACS